MSHDRDGSEHETQRHGHDKPALRCQVPERDDPPGRLPRAGVLRRFTAAGVADRAVLGAQIAVMALLVAISSAAMIALGFAVHDLSAPA